MVSAVFCAVCAHAEKTCLAAKMLHGGGVAATHSTAVYQCVIGGVGKAHCRKRAVIFAPSGYHGGKIAVFTEIGETVEETVHREVMEEVGLKVKNLRYYKTQPWGISAGGLLVGFWCEVDGGDEIRVDHVELDEGAWVSREELRATYEDTGVSLTGEMIAQFIEGKNP